MEARMKFYFTQDQAVRNYYYHVEVPMEELEKYITLVPEERDEETFTDAALEWFEDQVRDGLQLEPDSTDVMDDGDCAAELQETVDRRVREALAAYKSCLPSPASISSEANNE
jgi:hypothetical protein